MMSATFLTFIINFPTQRAANYHPKHSNTYRRCSATVPARVVLGAQWDEGKGKAIDQLAPNSQWAVRFRRAIMLVTQSGRGATLKMHLLPSGITAGDCNLVLGCGMVVDPWVLDRLSEGRTDRRRQRKRLFISERAAVILPFHRLYDSADGLVGTTGKGIGPAYRDGPNG